MKYMSIKDFARAQRAHSAIPILWIKSKPTI